MNKGDIFEIDFKEKYIKVNGGASEMFSEILNITYYTSPSWIRKGVVRYLPFEDYHYARIKMKNGSEYIFTCLMHYDVESVFKNVNGLNVKRSTRFFSTCLYK